MEEDKMDSLDEIKEIKLNNTLKRAKGNHKVREAYNKDQKPLVAAHLITLPKAYGSTETYLLCFRDNGGVFYVADFGKGFTVVPKKYAHGLIKVHNCNGDCLDKRVEEIELTNLGSLLSLLANNQPSDMKYLKGPIGPCC